MVILGLVALVGLLALSIPVGAGLGVLGLVLDAIYSPMPLARAMGEVSWSTTTSFILVAVPFFILLGEIMLRSGTAERMYGAMIHWVSWLPGGLMHSNIAACAMFAATSGSSVATAATIGTVAIGQIEKYKYNQPLFLGTLASGGTLGILIPPSINLIVYGVLTETSIPQLYLAGVIPGLILAGLFMLTVLVACLLKPSWGGTPIETNWTARLKSLPDLIPPVVLFVVVIGSIYTGLATPTESAALGVLCGLIIAGFKKQLTVRMLRDALEGTMKTTGMIIAIMIGAYFLNFVITTIGLTRTITGLVTAFGLSPMQTLTMVIVFYLLLGCFMETLSMMVATVPITASIMISLGFDPVWYGILIVVLIETALITPPVGFNLYVIHGLRPRGRLIDVIVGAVPFVGTLLVMLVLLVMYPNIALWLPRVTSH